MEGEITWSQSTGVHRCPDFVDSGVIDPTMTTWVVQTAATRSKTRIGFGFPRKQTKEIARLRSMPPHGPRFSRFRLGSKREKVGYRGSPKASVDGIGISSPNLAGPECDGSAFLPWVCSERGHGKEYGHQPLQKYVRDTSVYMVRVTVGRRTGMAAPRRKFPSAT